MAEGGGLLNRYRGSTPIVSSNPIPSASYRLSNDSNKLPMAEAPILTNA